MKGRITYVERKPSNSVSIERVFRQVVQDIPAAEFDLKFQNVPFGNGIFAILRNLLFYRPAESDIYHITGDIHYIALRLPGNRTVLTIHDLIFLHRRSGIRRYVLKKLFLDIPLRRCARITTVSQATKDEILKYANIDEKQIAVIDNPISPNIVPGKVKPFDSDSPRILHIGTAENKNLANLITAVKGLNCTLRIIGRLDDKIREQLVEDEISFENASGLDEEQMIAEYREADIVSFCSIYEGFGLPIVETQSMHKPVVTSDLAPMNEVAGGAAVLVDPYDPASIRAGIEKIINEPEYRDLLTEAGTANVKRYDRAAIAERYAVVYRELLHQLP